MNRLFTICTLCCLQWSLFSQANADCWQAKEICKKQVYHIEHAGGEGSNNQEADFTSCFMNGDNFGQAEENSTWIRFEIKKSGTLSFAITPHRLDDDIDFVVYKLPADGNCQYKQIVRCMAAGDIPDNALSSPCMGETGLRDGETDSSEDAGCADPGDNTWLAPLRVVAGEKYVILVSNVTTSGPGFSIRFSGTAMLPCDEEKKPVATPPAVPKKTTPPPQPAPAPAPKPNAPPQQIGGRDVEVNETIKVKSRKVKVKIWDSQIEDGDVISIYLDDKKVLDHQYLRKKPFEFDVEIPAGREHYLTVYADDFGKAEPNTAMVVINDGVHEQTIDLVAGRKKQECVKIIMEE